MSIFLTLMVIGLVGLLLMGLPGLGQHGHWGHGLAPGGHGLGHGGPLPGVGQGHLALPHAGAHANAPGGMHLPAHTAQGASSSDAGPYGAVGSPGAAAGEMSGILRFIPSPRPIFSLMALYGAFGYALAGGTHLGVPLSAAAALVPAGLMERFMLTPLWNLLFQFQGKPSSSLDELVTERAEAVTPFRNGRGLVRVLHDGRSVQLNARLTEKHSSLAVHVGDGLIIEEVDAPNERVTVSLE